MANRQREEVLNVVMAECISERGMSASPENIITISKRKRAMPDVIVSFRGLRCVIEGKFSDAQNAYAQVEHDIRDRIANGIAYLAIGVVYPSFLRQTPFKELSAALIASSLEFMVCSEAGCEGWRQGTLDSLLDELRRAYGLLINDDVLERSVERLEVGMQSLVNVLTSSTATCMRLADLLGVYQGDKENGTDEH